jgi:2-oxo-4-hydroxy-4-carboxy-5-ureidoimidazoline decarboxylase
MNLEQINTWAEQDAVEKFRRCCGSSRWSDRMARKRPFQSEASLFAAAEQTWWGLAQSDWLEAFAAHPKIGDTAALKAKFAATAAWSAAEQAGVATAVDDVLDELAALNHRYEARFGYIFIVCATGKSAGEMLTLLRARMHNTALEEIKFAAAEQWKITQIRLEKITP